MSKRATGESSVYPRADGKWVAAVTSEEWAERYLQTQEEDQT